MIRPTTGLPFVNADVIARSIAGDGPITEEISIAAAQAASERRDELLRSGVSFVAETVFSHPSKVELVRTARDAGYFVHLFIVVVPVDLTAARVRARVANGGHDVPEDRIRARYERLWPLVADAVRLANEAVVYDNSRIKTPFQVIARFAEGVPVDAAFAPWPKWAPAVLKPDAFGQ